MVIMYEVVNRASNHLFSESILFFRRSFYPFKVGHRLILSQHKHRLYAIMISSNPIHDRV